MRILHVHSGNIFGGVERILLALAAHKTFSAEFEHVFALCFGGRLSQELSEKEAGVFLLPSFRFSRPWEWFRARASLRALLSKESFDLAIVHSAWSHIAFARTLRAHGLPELFWLHTTATGSSMLEKLARLRFPNRVLSVSAAVDESAKILFPGVASSVVYSPLALDTGAFLNADREKKRKALGVEGDEVVILQASRLEDWKGHVELIGALKLLRDDARWKCWIAGGASNSVEVEYLARLRGLASDLGPRVQFLGARADIPELLKAADIYCQPNLKGEGFSVIFMEAFYAGLPIVTSAMGGATEIVDATSGVLLKPGDTAGLAEALRELIAKPSVRERMGEEGRRRLMERCDPAAQFPKLEDVFRKTIAAHG